MQPFVVSSHGTLCEYVSGTDHGHAVHTPSAEPGSGLEVLAKGMGMEVGVAVKRRSESNSVHPGGLSPDSSVGICGDVVYGGAGWAEQSELRP